VQHLARRGAGGQADTPGGLLIRHAPEGTVPTMTNPLTPDVLSDPVELTRALVDIESVSLNEKVIADCVEEALRAAPHLTLARLGKTVMGRTHLGRAQRGALVAPL